MTRMHLPANLSMARLRASSGGSKMAALVAALKGNGVCEAEISL